MTKTIRNIFSRKHLLISIFFIIVLIIAYLFVDYWGPGKIPLRNDIAFGFPCLRASDLIVQEYDKNGNLWATRGMIVYQLKKGDNKFTKITHVPTGLSVFWLRNFSILRRLSLRPECVEMTITDNGNLYALSAGKIWLLSANEKKFKESLKLSNYGFGDQGIRNDGIININDSTVFVGEYFRNPNKEKVKIFESRSKMGTWENVYEFPPGRIRHIHAIQKDPYSGKLWICTGDLDEESLVAWSDDEFKTIQNIGYGSQIWRVCQLIFTEKNVLWGTDTASEKEAGIYSWDRNTGEVQKYQGIDGAIFFGTKLKNGTMVMSSDREGFKNEKDDKTRLYVISKDFNITSLECGTWDHKKPGFWFKYAMLRFQRDQGGPSLVITCLNQKEFPESELIIISEDSLISITKNVSASPK